MFNLMSFHNLYYILSFYGTVFFLSYNRNQWAPVLFGHPCSSKYVLVCSAEKRKGDNVGLYILALVVSHSVTLFQFCRSECSPSLGAGDDWLHGVWRVFDLFTSPVCSCFTHELFTHAPIKTVALIHICLQFLQKSTNRFCVGLDSVVFCSKSIILQAHIMSELSPHSCSAGFSHALRTSSASLLSFNLFFKPVLL